MFNKSGLMITQDNRSLEVTLYGHRKLPYWASFDATFMNFLSKNSVWGLWTVADDSRTIGDANPQNRCWVYLIEGRQLRFVQNEWWIGGGEKFGEEDNKLRTALTLYQVALRSYGFDHAGSGPAPGVVDVWSSVFHQGPVTWDSLGYSD